MITVTYLSPRRVCRQTCSSTPITLTPSNRGGSLDQHPLALGQDRVVGGVPRHPETLGDPGHGQVLTHDALQRPPQPAPGQLRPRLGGLGGVLAPHVPAPGAPVAADRDLQRRRPPPQRLVRQPPDHACPAAAPRSRSGGTTASGSTTRQASTARSGSSRCPVTSRPSSSSRQNVVRSGQAKEGSVRHVEVFQMGGVRTPIIGRPRPLPGHRRADPRYTLNCEEPVNSSEQSGLRVDGTKFLFGFFDLG